MEMNVFCHQHSLIPKTLPWNLGQHYMVASMRCSNNVTGFFFSPSLIFKAVQSFPHYRGQTFCLFVYLLRVHLPIRENNGFFQFSISWNFFSSLSESVVNEQ